jgi:hypothetical protein
MPSGKTMKSKATHLSALNRYKMTKKLKKAYNNSRRRGTAAPNFGRMKTRLLSEMFKNKKDKNAAISKKKQMVKAIADRLVSANKKLALVIKEYDNEINKTKPNSTLVDSVSIFLSAIAMKVKENTDIMTHFDSTEENDVDYLEELSDYISEKIISGFKSKSINLSNITTRNMVGRALLHILEESISEHVDDLQEAVKVSRGSALSKAVDDMMVD